MNRLVCLVYKGYLKGIIDSGIEAGQIEERVREFLKDIKLIMAALADDTLGHRDLEPIKSLFEKMHK